MHAFNILSFNVLAESYLTPRSHPGLPPHHAEVAFHPPKRREVLVQTLQRFAGKCKGRATEPKKGEEDAEKLVDADRFDILCLQEVDLPDLIFPLMANWGYGCVHALDHYASVPSSDGARNGDDANSANVSNQTTAKTKPSRGKARPKPKSDTCAIFYSTDRFRLVASQIVEFDDLAGGPALGKDEPPRTKSGIGRARRGRGGAPTQALSGMIQSYRRRNRAVVAVLEVVEDGTHETDGKSSVGTQSRRRRRICVSNGHLYWHPGYEYVKLSQAKYWTQKVEEFAMQHAGNVEGNGDKHGRVPVLLCGDLNSKPGSAVHTFLTEGTVDARTVAPWNPKYYDSLDADVAELEVADKKGSRKKAGKTRGEGSVRMLKDPHSEDDPVVPLDDDEDGIGNNDGTNDGCADNTDDVTDAVQNLKLKCEGRKVGGADADDYTAMALTPGNGLQKIKAPIYRSKEIHDTTPQANGDSTPRYLCDYTLNRFTRWLRILGIDAALETQEEEKERTKNNTPTLFQRCRSERRTLLTTSKNLLLRKDCPPGAYLIDPKKTSDLEKAMVQLFLTHGVVLRPCEFVTRCVVCNGTIYTVANEEDKAKIFEANGCPDLKTDLSVYACNGCGQGYWWCTEMPTSSATRVKDQAAHLFRQCLRGGVPCEGDLRMFDFVDPEAERKIGEEEGTLAGKGRPEAPMEGIIGWLKNKDLGHSFELRSSYALVDEDADKRVIGEMLPFTNVTADFVGLLDYIFFETSEFEQTHRVEVPTSFRKLNNTGETCGHLLPSDVWPSDHLALGARFVLKGSKAVAVQKEKASAASIPGAGWAIPAGNHQPGFPMCDCGCVPKVPSLFEMAELRKQARLKAEKEKGR